MINDITYYPCKEYNEATKNKDQKKSQFQRKVKQKPRHVFSNLHITFLICPARRQSSVKERTTGLRRELIYYDNEQKKLKRVLIYSLSV